MCEESKKLQNLKFGQKVYIWDSGRFPKPLKAVVISGVMNHRIYIAIEPYDTSLSAKRVDVAHVNDVFSSIEAISEHFDNNRLAMDEQLKAEQQDMWIDDL